MTAPIPISLRGSVRLGAALLFAVACGCGSEPAWHLAQETAPTTDGEPALAETAGEHWPGFRGVNGTGVSSAVHLPVTWDDRIGVRWSVLLPGEGNSSPIVWGDRLFLTLATPQREVFLVCIDREDGTLLWQRSAGFATGRRHAKNGDASPTPVTDGRRVFAFFGSAGMICCDFSGNLLWQTSLGDLDHPWGGAGSPILYDDLVIQLCDSETDSSLVALDKRTGRIVWRTPRQSSGCWSTPAIVRQADRRHAIVVNGTGVENTEQGYVIGYSPRTGKELWRVRGTTDTACPVPLVVDDLVIVSSGRRGPTKALRPGGGDPQPSGTRDSRSTPHCEVVWSIPRSGSLVPTGVVYDQMLYQVSDNGIFTCRGLDTGEAVYEERLPGNFSAGLIAGEGRVYATSEEGRTYVIQAGPQFQLIGENHLPAPVLATPAVAAGDLFIRTRRQLYCIPSQPPEPESVAVAPPADTPDADSAGME